MTREVLLETERIPRNVIYYINTLTNHMTNSNSKLSSFTLLVIKDFAYFPFGAKNESALHLYAGLLLLVGSIPLIQEEYVNLSTSRRTCCRSDHVHFL